MRSVCEEPFSQINILNLDVNEDVARVDGLQVGVHERYHTVA
jgi:hypothetical protein